MRSRRLKQQTTIAKEEQTASLKQPSSSHQDGRRGRGFDISIVNDTKIVMQVPPSFHQPRSNRVVDDDDDDDEFDDDDAFDDDNEDFDEEDDADLSDDEGFGNYADDDDNLGKRMSARQTMIALRAKHKAEKPVEEGDMQGSFAE